MKCVRGSLYREEFIDEGDDEEDDDDDDDSTGKIKRTKECKAFLPLAHEEIIKFANCQGLNEGTIQKRPKNYFQPETIQEQSTK